MVDALRQKHANYETRLLYFAVASILRLYPVMSRGMSMQNDFRTLAAHPSFEAYRPTK